MSEQFGPKYVYFLPGDKAAIAEPCTEDLVIEPCPPNALEFLGDREVCAVPLDGTWIPPSKGKDAMTRERWQRIKALKPRDTQMFVSCAPDKNKHSRATYRKAEHGTTD